MAAAAAGGATNAREGVSAKDSSSSQDYPSPDSHFIHHSHVLCVSLGHILLLAPNTWRNFCRRVRTIHRMKQKMLKTHLHLCLGITHTISCHTRLTQSRWSKLSKCAATAHTDLPLVPWKDKSCCCSNRGFWDTEMWRADRGQPSQRPGNLPSFLSFYSYLLADPSLQLQAQTCSQRLRASVQPWDP